jgi:hypothetical protein
MRIVGAIAGGAEMVLVTMHRPDGGIIPSSAALECPAAGPLPLWLQRLATRPATAPVWIATSTLVGRVTAITAWEMLPESAVAVAGEAGSIAVWTHEDEASQQQQQQQKPQQSGSPQIVGNDDGGTGATRSAAHTDADPGPNGAGTAGTKLNSRLRVCFYSPRFARVRARDRCGASKAAAEAAAAAAAGIVGPEHPFPVTSESGIVAVAVSPNTCCIAVVTAEAVYAMTPNDGRIFAVIRAAAGSPFSGGSFVDSRRLVVWANNINDERAPCAWMYSLVGGDWSSGPMVFGGGGTDGGAAAAAVVRVTATETVRAVVDGGGGGGGGGGGSSSLAPGAAVGPIALLRAFVARASGKPAERGRPKSRALISFSHGLLSRVAADRPASIDVWDVRVDAGGGDDGSGGEDGNCDAQPVSSEKGAAQSMAQLAGAVPPCASCDLADAFAGYDLPDRGDPEACTASTGFVGTSGMAVGPVTAALDQCPVPPCAPLLVRGHRDGSLTISRLIPDAPQLAADEPPTASMSDGGGDSGRIRNPGRGAARQEQRHRLCAHAAGPVTCVAVVGAGTTVVSGAADGSVVFIERFDDALVLDNTSAARARCGFGGGGGGSLMPQPCSPAHARYHHELRPHWGGVASLTEIADGRIVSMGCIDGVVAVMRSAIWGEPYLSGLELFDFFFLIFFFFSPWI